MQHREAGHAENERSVQHCVAGPLQKLRPTEFGVGETGWGWGRISRKTQGHRDSTDADTDTDAETETETEIQTPKQTQADT